MSTLNPTARSQEPAPPLPVELCVLLGRLLFSLGASTRRIHFCVAYLARHLGCNLEMLVSYDALLLAIDDGVEVRTRIASSRGFVSLNLSGLVRINEWLRELQHSRSSAAELERQLTAIRDAAPLHGWPMQLLAAGCAGAGFCIVNGGDPLSWLCAFVAAMLIFIIRRPLAARRMNVHFTIFVVALAGSFLAGLLARITNASTPAVALLAPLLFLVPGVPLIIGGMDIVRNHVTIGLARIGFTLAVLAALCLGAALTLPLLPERISPPFAFSGYWQLVSVSLAGALASAALALLNNGNGPLIALCAVGGLTARLVRALMVLKGFDPITASLVGVVCSTLLTGFVSRRLRWPAIFAAVISALPMVPGYFAIDGLHALVSFSAASSPNAAQVSQALHALSRAVFISVALVVGVIGPAIILREDTEPVFGASGSSRPK